MTPILGCLIGQGLEEVRWKCQINTFLVSWVPTAQPSAHPSSSCANSLTLPTLLDRPCRGGTVQTHPQGRTHSCCYRGSPGPLNWLKLVTLGSCINPSCPAFSSPTPTPNIHSIKDFRSEFLVQHLNFLAFQDHLPVNCKHPRC